ncbi:MAG: hypothetical protein MI922_18530, partial [Bacteroidales bacterium]|nr:hypothetical protein [Bacteroidales bacterium]
HLNYYIAERISRRGKQPQRIELWFDNLSHQIQEVICSGFAFHSPRATRYTLHIKLTDTTVLPENWFQQAAHMPDNQ